MSSVQSTYIIDGVRSPIGKFGGSLSTIRADDLAAITIKQLVSRFSQIPLDVYDDLMLGCANQAGEDNRNVARMASLLAGLPWQVPGETVNRLCASGLAACINASRAIGCNEGDLIIAGGVEHMTRAPWVMSKSSSAFGRDSELHDSSFGWRFVNPLMKKMYGTDAMGETAENLVAKYKISRDAQDEFAFRSQMKATASQKSGRLAREICSLEIPINRKEKIKFEQDEFIKPNTSLDVLSKLNPAFKSKEAGGTVTAGNSSGLNDGSAALLLSSEKAIRQYNLKPLARIVSAGVAGVEPSIMGIGPVPASALALKRAGLHLEQMDLIELNEAFAAQVLACLSEWKIDAADPRLNPNGGAIALGHPLGMSGARLLLSAAIELAIANKKYALVTMCIGVGQGYACIIENCEK